MGLKVESRQSNKKAKSRLKGCMTFKCEGEGKKFASSFLLPTHSKCWFGSEIKLGK